MSRDLTKTPLGKDTPPETQERGVFVDMKVKIRSQEKCPICNSNFKTTLAGLACPAHPKVRPSTFYLDWWTAGENFRLYGYGSFKDALTKAGAIEQDIIEFKFKPQNYRGYTAKVSRKFAFEERFDAWLAIKRKQLKPATLRKMDQYREEYLEAFGREDIRTIGTDLIMSYYESLIGKVSKKTIYNKLGVLHSFFQSLFDREAIRQMPKFPEVKYTRKAPSEISEEQQILILNAMPERHRSIFKFLFETGCRHGEARAVHWADVDFEKNWITIRHNFSGDVLTTPKTGDERGIPLTRALRDVLLRHPKTLRSEFIFNIKGKPYYESAIGKIWRAAAKKVGIQIHPYGGTRHSFASQMVSRGISLEIIGTIMGHSDIRTTKKYARVNMDAMRKAMEG
jgi:integrase